MPDKGFFKTLFDLSFSEFVTTKLIKFLYILILVFIAIGYLVSVIGGFADSAGQGFLMLIVGAVGALVAVLFARVYMEILIVLFRIAENTSEIARRGRFQE
jgi:hypothetical protein